jgi:hypothetical protein
MIVAAVKFLDNNVGSRHHVFEIDIYKYYP